MPACDSIPEGKYLEYIPGGGVELYTIFVDFNAFVNEPIIILLPPPICNAHTVAIVLHDYCGRYAPPPTLLLYAIHHTISVMAILCKGQGGGMI